MELKNKIKKALLSIICGIMLITAVFFGIVAVIYTVGGGTPNLFGTTVYLVKTNAFDELTDGTALLAKQVPYSEIQPGNFVIFSLENNRPAIAEIQTVELSDGVYGFTALTENNDPIALSQSQIVAKGMSYSRFWGVLISFAISPLGVLLIAVVPCVIIIIIELAKFVRKTLPEPEIETVKKQLEVPTYAPDSRRKSAVKAYEKNNSLDDSIGLYDAQVRRNPSIERTDVLEIPAQETPLFLGPKRKQVAIPKQHIQESPMPLSQKKLNDAIAASKAQHSVPERQTAAEQSNADMEEAIRSIQRRRSAAIAAEKERESLSDTARQNIPNTRQKAPQAEQKREQTVPSRTDFVPKFSPTQKTSQIPVPDEEQVKQYTPRRVQTPQVHATSSIPRLDALLSDDNDGDSYNIDDILSELGKDRK